MKFRTNNHVSLIVLIGLLTASCSSTKVPLKFVLLSESVRKVPEVKTDLQFAGRTYIIYNYKDNEYCEKQIDSLAYKLGNENKDKYYSFVVDFYKASDETNIENLRKNPRQLDRYSNTHDYIRKYSWSNKSFSGKNKYKNGKSVGGAKIYVSEAPPLKK